MVYLPMSYLYGKRFVGPITPTVLSLRKELFTVPYHEIDWNQARNECAKVGQLSLSHTKAKILFMINWTENNISSSAT